MKNILVKNSLKSILMSVLILFIIPATNSKMVSSTNPDINPKRTDCDKDFQTAFWGVCNDTNSNNNNDNANDNGNITNTNETTLGQPNEHPESGKADDSKSEPLFSNIYDRPEAERNKYFVLKKILLEKQNNNK